MQKCKYHIFEYKLINWLIYTVGGINAFLNALSIIAVSGCESYYVNYCLLYGIMGIVNVELVSCPLIS